MKLAILTLTVLFSFSSLKAQVCPLKTSISDSIQTRLSTGATKTSSAIVLRCNFNSSENNNVIYVVDGILFETKEISNLNPFDILSIEILKESQQIISCRMINPVIIITTKKQYHREFIVRDAKSLLGVGNATIEARSTKTGKSFFFTADEFGKLETDSLKSNDYVIKISAVGYKTKKITLKCIQQYKGEIKLEREFVELKEINIIAYQKVSCRKIGDISNQGNILFGRLACLTGGIEIINSSKETEIKNDININKAISVYPNPVAASGTINISFPNVKPGQYQIRMLNAAGQLFYSFQKQITGKGETEQIHLNGNTLPGMYIVQIVDEQKKLVQTSKIVVQ